VTFPCGAETVSSESGRERQRAAWLRARSVYGRRGVRACGVVCGVGRTAQPAADTWASASRPRGGSPPRARQFHYAHV